MATTLSRDQEEMAFFSFPIEKREDTATINPVDGTPDILIWGKATDGTIDGDREIVDPEWSAKAIQQWADTGANVRMSHDPKRPVGKGQQVQITTDGHYVKSLICDPLAKHFIRAGVLNDYSVGIMNPDFRHRDPKLDPHGKALRIITGRPDGLSRIGEISICDRGSNFNSSFQIVKSAGGFTGQMVGDEDEITKAAPSGLLTKMAHDDGFVNVDLPRDASISISPADFARLHTFKQQLVTKAAGTAVEADAEKRDVSTAERRSLASEGNALPDGSYSINSTGDLRNAAHLARTGHGDVAAARRLIARRARELGVANPLDESDGVKKSEPYTGPVEPVQEALEKVAAERPDSVIALPPVVKEAEPDVTKDREPEPKPKPVKKAKKPKKMPPWLNKPKDGDGDSDGDSKGDSDDDASKACKSFLDHTWIGTSSVAGPADVECSKCHTSPAQAAGVTASQMDPAPVKELMESDGPVSTKGATPASASGAVAETMKPVPAHREPDGATTEAFEKDAGLPSDGEPANSLEAAAGMKQAALDLAPDPEVAALLRFKMTGTDEDLGRLHDLTCPAYSPDMAAKYHPYATLPGLIDAGAWQRKTLAAAAGPLEKAREMAELWQAVHVLKSADQAALNDWRLELHKAFRDANPGPGSFPTPGCVSPQRYNRPVLTDGRGANAADYSGPTTAPQVATSPPDAQDFSRPPLSSAQASPSPSFMKGGGAEYPAERGVPQRITYEALERDKARRALSMLHDHLNHMFPSACPMLDQDAYRQPEARAVPAPAGIGKGDGDSVPAMLDNGYAVPAAALKATPEEDGLFADADVYKGFKKARKKLGKKVLSGKMTVDEARSRLGRQFAQKGAEPPAEAVQKGSGLSPAMEASVIEAQAGIERRAQARHPVAAALDPEVIKAAVIEATAPLLERLEKQDKTFAEEREATASKLAEQQRVIDAIADQPDPSTAAFSGLAFQPGVMKSRRPAAVPDQAEYAARAQDMIRRNLLTTYQTHSDPHVREAAGQSLATMGAGMEAPPMT